MREIKFRGKRVDNGEWIKGYFYEECDNTYIIQDRQNSESKLCRNTPHVVDPATVGQYAGLDNFYCGDLFYYEHVQYVLDIFPCFMAFALKRITKDLDYPEYIVGDEIFNYTNNPCGNIHEPKP